MNANASDELTLARRAARAPVRSTHLIRLGLLSFLLLTLGCQSFHKNVRRKLENIEGQQIDEARVAFDSDALQIELRCRDNSDKCQENAERVRLELVAMLRQLESERKRDPLYPARVRIRMQITQYWNPLNLLVVPMIYGIPVDRQSADVDVQVEFNGKVYQGVGSGGCFSSLFIMRGPDGSDGCAMGEGIAEALNVALAAANSSGKDAQ